MTTNEKLTLSISVISVVLSIISLILTTCYNNKVLNLSLNQRIEDNIIEIRQEYDYNMTNLQATISNSVAFSLAFREENKEIELLEKDLNFEKFNSKLEQVINDDIVRNNIKFKELGENLIKKNKKLGRTNPISIIKTLKQGNELTKKSLPTIIKSIQDFSQDVDEFSKNYFEFIATYRMLKK